MINRTSACFAGLLTTFVAAMFACASAAELGATVTNIATVDYNTGAAPVTIQTPPASFIIEARRTPSTIEFFRYSPNAPDAVSVSINGSDFASSTGPGGNPMFQPVGPPVTGRTRLDLSSPLPIVPAQNYYSGELIIVGVVDEGQNGDAAQVETVVVTIVSGTGDQITLRLYESGPNTGEFFGYVQSVNGASPTDDAQLFIAQNLDLTATYQDPFDATEISTDVAGVDPFGRLFDSATGELIDGAVVTIVDAASGDPADVFGVDGVSDYPSTIITGSTVIDASGFVYDLGPGEFRFPIMFPGEYRLLIEPPAGYNAPSAATPETVSNLPNAPFILVDASYLGVFVLDGTGDVSFDVPLDPLSDLLVLKEASTEAGAIGDFIRYSVTVENTGDTTAFLAIRDELPRGFRYQAGSARRDGAPLANPAIVETGGVLTFQLGAGAAGETVELTYVAEIASGAVSGEAVNRAYAVNGAGAAISNIAEAAVFIREDLLRSRLTIVGRVSENACNPEDGWPREITGGVGVENVRLYMETGASVVTDEDGLYHFEDVEARTHVVQLDTATIPEGYEVVQCEENTRFAGSAISQFVDAQGGSVWRANFYLRRKAGAVSSAAAAIDEDKGFNDATEYLSFDKAWINRQTGETSWAYPQEGRTPSIRSVNIGIKHDATLRVALRLNGELVPTENFAGRDVGLTRKVALTRWRGVDLLSGENVFVATVYDQNKNEVGKLERRITFVDEVARAAFLPNQSMLLADGRSTPRIAVRVTDGAGRPVHAGRLISVEIEPPYRAKDLERLENALPLTAPLSSQSSAVVGPDGVAFIELEPTTETGNARVRVLTDDGGEEEITAYIKPALREWIVVGMAEGSLSRETTRTGDGAPKATDLLRDGRVAVFAKGAVKGDWLVTAAVDTAKKRGREDDELFEDIDPDARYPLYGDRSDQEFEAESRYPVYLKVEKNAFQALLGDYDTGLSDAKLGRYARRLSGVRTVYEGERFSFTGFAAETNQDFIRDEIPADGTSGTFRLSTTPIVRNSETLYIEARDRFRPDVIVGVTPLTRYADYDIDFRTGEVLFRLPIPAANDAASYNVIVAEYETFAAVDRNITAGGRAAARFLDGRAEIGLTGIHEEGRPGAVDGGGDLAAVDLVVDATDTTELRLEYGASRRDGALGREEGDALLAEINHTSGDLSASAYYADTDAGFGLNQQSSAIVGVRRYGLEANYRFDQFESQETGRRGERFVTAKAYREENLSTGARRSLAEVELRQVSDETSGAVGLRRVVEEPATGDARKSLLATSAIRQNFPKLGLSIYATRDQPISGENGSNFFPKRTTAGFDQRVFDNVTLSVSHEIQDGDNVSSSNTIVGVTAEPWAGANITASTDMLTQDSGKRIGATLGVDQQVRLSEKWSGSFGVSRRQELSSSGNIVDQPDDIVPDTPFSPLEEDREFTSVFVGAGYRTDLTAGSARFEVRKSVLGQRYTSVLGAAREVSEQLSFAGAARVEQENNDADPDRQTVDARLGMAWRPRGEGLIAFNRFDIKRDRIDGQSDSWKAVNNLAVNTMINERTQLTVNHGFKYAQLQADGASYSGVTQLFGAETRFDITERFDIGLRASALYSHNAGTVDYSYGPSIGFTPAKNIWLSAGWNFDGFTDDDFMAADFTRKGPFIQLRVKFDQTSPRGLLDSISPDSVRGARP